MVRACARTSLADLVGRIRPGMKVLIPSGCGEPVALLAEICRQADRLAPITLMGGMHLGDYPFCRPDLHGKVRFVTWHMSSRLREAARRGQVSFVPIRYFDVVRVFNHGGPWAPDCVVLHASPPDTGGRLSLGVSSSVTLPALLGTPLVIGQVNPRMPRTGGAALVAGSAVDAWAEVDEELPTYPPPPIGDTERAIGRQVGALVPDGATVQVGIGAIPQSTLESLADHRNLSLYSLLVDSAVGLCERGAVSRPIEVGEIMGTRRVFDFAHDNPMVSMAGSDRLHDPAVVASIDRFVSVNSALAIDLTGQVTAESLGSRQVAGIGGQFDFVLGASRSRGGLSVIALPSTDRSGTRSRIVARLASGAAVTTPRYLTDWVVTEHGAARLAGLSEAERAAALIAVAHPRFRAELRRSRATAS